MSLKELILMFNGSLAKNLPHLRVVRMFPKNRTKVKKHVQQMLDKQFWRSEQTRHEKLVRGEKYRKFIRKMCQSRQSRKIKTKTNAACLEVHEQRLATISVQS